MARMTLRAAHAAGERRRWPLSERIVDENLGGFHRVPQPRVRLGRPVVEADHDEASRAARAAKHAARAAEDAARAAEDAANGAEHGEQPRDGGESHDGHEQELVDVKWLFAWTDELRRERRLIKRHQPYRGAISRLRTRGPKPPRSRTAAGGARRRCTGPRRAVAPAVHSSMRRISDPVAGGADHGHSA